MLRQIIRDEDKDWYRKKIKERNIKREKRVMENLDKMLAKNDLQKEKEEGSLINFWNNLIKKLGGK
jgi:hypothetical protein